MKKNEKRGKSSTVATAGFVLCIIATVVSGVVLAACATCYVGVKAVENALENPESTGVAADIADIVRAFLDAFFS